MNKYMKSGLFKYYDKGGMQMFLYAVLRNRTFCYQCFSLRTV